MNYIGDMSFRGIDFTFGFDGKRLDLAPCSGEEEKARCLTMRKQDFGWSYPGDPVLVEDEYFVMKPRNCDLSLVVFPGYDRFLPTDMYMGAMHIGAGSYFEVAPGRKVSCLRFKSRHLGMCYDSREPVRTNIDLTARSFSAEVVPFAPRIVDFSFRGVSVASTLLHERQISKQPGQPPLMVNSVMEFEFPETDDFGFVRDLIRVARNMLQFCFQADDADFDSIELRGPCRASESQSQSDDGKRDIVRIGKVGGLENSPDDLRSKFHVPLGKFEKLDSGLLQLLADGDLSMSHLVGSEAQSHWDASRCILLAASFDYEVGKLYPGGIPHKPETITARNLVLEHLDKAAEEKNPKKAKKKVKSLVKKLKGIAERGDSFSSRLRQLRKDHSSALGGLGRGLDDDGQFNEMSQRVEAMRNALAHGDLSASFDDRILEDVIALERIVLATQMLRMGLTDEEAAQAVKMACER